MESVARADTKTEPPDTPRTAAQVSITDLDTQSYGTLDFKRLCERALRCLPWTMCPEHPIAVRERNHDADPTQDRCNGRSNPTATSHVLLALMECGVDCVGTYNNSEYETYDVTPVSRLGLNTKQWPRIWHPIAIVRGLLRLPDQDVAQHEPESLARTDEASSSTGTSIDLATTIQQYFNTLGEKPVDVENRRSLQGTNTAWVLRLMEDSMHCKNDGPRELILFGHLLPAFAAVLGRGFHPNSVEDSQRLCMGTIWIVHRINLLLKHHLPEGIRFRKSSWKMSPYFLTNAAQALQASESILSSCGIETSAIVNLGKLIDPLRRRLEDCFEDCIDRMMARRHVEGDPAYDAISLVFALRGLSDLSPRFRTDSFFLECIRAIVADQQASGLWPDGIASSDPSDQAAWQQPSVEVALHLAQTVFRDRMLFKPTVSDIVVMQQSLPALHRIAAYLFASRQQIRLAGNAYGWSSDRTRAPFVVETWATALAARSMCSAYLIERSISRASTLQLYGVELPREPNEELPESRYSPIDSWNQRVVEVDGIGKPKAFIRDTFIRPIAESAAEGPGLIRPGPRGVSFILYGPPGSGKTFLVKSLAKALDWPLLSLNPGNFIIRGLEGIERTAAEIFSRLATLDHCVVFFDECDELFRDRSVLKDSPRNVLSFATASMLPKLQRLRLDRRVVFVVATNYISNIDDAVRRIGRFDAKILFDRPDENARMEIIRRERPPVFQPLSLAKLKSMADATAGLTYDELKELAMEPDPSPPAEARRQTAISDYTDWCAQRGESELIAASVDTEVQKLTVARWKSLPGYEAALRRGESQQSFSTTEHSIPMPQALASGNS